MTNPDYVINKNTSAICSHFDNNGYEHSVILKSNGDEIYDQKSPTKIVDYSFKHKIKGLQGAIHCARFILNKKQDVPVIYSLSNKCTKIHCNRILRVVMKNLVLSKSLH